MHVAAQRAAVEHLCATLLPAELQAVADARGVAPYKLEDLAKAEGLRAFLTSLSAAVRSSLSSRVGAAADTPDAVHDRLLQHGTRLMLLKLPADTLRSWVALSGGSASASRTDQASSLSTYIFTNPPPAPPPSHHPVLGASELYCECRQPQGGRFMISCDGCEEWYHGDCVGVRELDVPNTPDFRWYCRACIKKGKSRGPSNTSSAESALKKERSETESVQLTVETAEGEKIDLRAHLAPATAQRLSTLIGSHPDASLSLCAPSPALHFVVRLGGAVKSEKNAVHVNNNGSAPVGAAALVADQAKQ